MDNPDPHVCTVCLQPLENKEFAVTRLTLSLITKWLEETYQDCDNRLVCRECMARLHKLFNGRQINYKAERRG